MSEITIQQDFICSIQNQDLDEKIIQQRNLHRTFFPKSKMRVEGHRGMGLMEPENTMKAFEKAIEYGLDGIELDVWLTMDGVPVVVHGHDDDGSVKFVHKTELIEKMTLDEIRMHRLEIGECIPTLKDVLELAKDQIVVNIEFKGENLILVDKVFEVINQLQMWTEITFSSFHFPFYERVQSTLQIMDIKQRAYFGFLIWKMEDFLHYEKYNFNADDSLNLDIQLLIDHREVILAHIQKAQSRNQRIKFYFPMTLKETKDLYDDLLALEVDTIITNYPIELIQYLNKAGQNTFNECINANIHNPRDSLSIETKETVQDLKVIIDLVTNESSPELNSAISMDSEISIQELTNSLNIEIKPQIMEAIKSN